MRVPMPQLKLYLIMVDDKPYKWCPDPIRTLATLKLDKPNGVVSVVEWDYDKVFDDPRNKVRHMEVEDA